MKENAFWIRPWLREFDATLKCVVYFGVEIIEALVAEFFGGVSPQGDYNEHKLQSISVFEQDRVEQLPKLPECRNARTQVNLLAAPSNT